MAAEIRSRLGYMNRTQAWLQENAKVPSATWRKYFTEGAIERDVPLVVVQRIATVLGLTTGELVTLAEESAPEFVAEDLAGATPAEKKDLRRAIARARPSRARKASGRSDTGT